MFFSGGVDSFYSLVLNPDVDLLVFMAGFDVRLHKRDTWEAMIRSHRELAAELGIRLVTVMTNVRAHPVLGAMRWPRYHGVILAALAHALRREASRWIVSATYGTGNLQPLGTHPDLDWRWGDEQVEIVHFGVDKWRAGKLVSMADVPMVHRRLRVCYGDPRAAGNCGRCEKCVRTRVIYHLYLRGISWPGAADEPPLAAAIDAVRELGPPSLIEEYRGLLQRCAGSDPVAMALRRLIERSERALAPAAPAVTFSDHGWRTQQRSSP